MCYIVSYDMAKLLYTALLLSVAAVMAAGLPQRAQGDRPADDRPTTTRLCDREECTCTEEDGQEVVKCDCARVQPQQPLLLGDRSALITGLPRRLEVTGCDRVSVHSQALSQSIELRELRLTDIAELELQELSIYTNNGPARAIHISGIGNLTVADAAFNEVTVLKRLELQNVTTDRLPEKLFGLRGDVIDFRIADSKITKLEGMMLPKADNLTVDNNIIQELSLDVTDVLAVNITGNTVSKVNKLMFNTRPSFHSNDNNTVTLAGNTIASMDSDGVLMTAETFYMVNNTVGSLTGPLRVTFHQAHVTGNTFAHVSGAAFAAFSQLSPLDIRLRPEGVRPKVELAFNFADNLLQSAANGSYGHLLYPEEGEDSLTLFHVRGNRFRCQCGELAELVEAGDRAFLAAANATDNEEATKVAEEEVVPAWNVVQALYETATCEDGLPLPQYRLTNFTADYDCPQVTPTTRTPTDGAAVTSASLLTLLLAALTAAAAAC